MIISLSFSVCAGSACRGRGVQDGRSGSAEQASDHLVRQPAGGGGTGSLCRLQPLLWHGRPGPTLVPLHVVFPILVFCQGSGCCWDAYLSSTK